jgi:leucyl-tRNA synthetase
MSIVILSFPGTGIVTSVPSDSADDYAALKDLIDKPAFREKFGVTEEMISCAPLVPVIQIPSYGTMAAVEAYEKYKVKSQHDKEALAAIKTELYKKGYYDGIMLAGPYKGEKVSVVKSSIKNQLIDEKQAIVYFETEKPVITRKGDTCIVALCNQVIT